MTCKRCPSGSVRDYGRNPETGSYGDVCVSCPAGKTLSSIPVSFAATDSSTPSTVVPATNIRNLSTISSSSSDVYSSSTGYLQVVFTSDYVITRPGFVAHWNVSSPVGATVSCTCNEAMPATCAEMSSLEDSTSGTFSLPSYANNARCEWLITADGGDAVINLTFTSFVTESGYDYVVINRCQVEVESEGEGEGEGEGFYSHDGEGGEGYGEEEEEWFSEEEQEWFSKAGIGCNDEES